jgi:ribokinase
LRRPTLFIGAVGDDTFEGEARRALLAERVDVSMVASLPGQATGLALILVDATGENEIAVVPGANGAIETGYVRDCLARLGPLAGDVLLVCNEVPLHVVREALVCGHSAGATTILNPAPAIGIDRSVFGLADIVAPNRNELATLLQTEAHRTGRRVDASSEAAVRARSLLEPGPSGPGVRKAVIVTLGAVGVVVLERVGSGLTQETRPPAAPPPVAPPVIPAAASAGPVFEFLPDELSGGAEPCDDGLGSDSGAPAVQSEAPAVPAPSIPDAPAGSIRVWEVPADRVVAIDSTGAGDAFCGALAAALAEGRSLAEAVQRAVAAGALATTHSGAREGMPTASELEDFLAARPQI